MIQQLLISTKLFSLQQIRDEVFVYLWEPEKIYNFINSLKINIQNKSRTILCCFPIFQKVFITFSIISRQLNDRTNENVENIFCISLKKLLRIKYNFYFMIIV